MSDLNEILFVLGIPLLGGLVLAFFGGRPGAAMLNVIFSLLTFVAGGLLTLRVVGEGSILAYNEMFFVDSFNVFLVALTVFVSFNTALFSRPYMMNEHHHGKQGHPENGRASCRQNFHEILPKTLR